MNSKYFLAIAATILLMFLLFSKDRKHIIKKNITNEVETEIDNSPENIVKAIPVQTTATSADLKVKPPALKAIEKTHINENILKNFSSHLKLMTKCLGLTGAININEKTDPTLENLTEALRTSLGDMVVQMDDWSQTEFIDQGTTRKRVRVDYDYPDGKNPMRRLSMYQINSYGMPEIVNLTAEEVNNPNEAYVSSLYEGRKIINEEKGARAYFPDGEEMIFSVRNGQLQSVSINKSDRSFNCFNLDEENSSCTCP